MSRKDAPTKPLPVLQYNEALEQVQVEVSGKKVWMDTADLRLNPGKIVKLPCQKVPTSLAADAHNPSTLGYGPGCSGQ
ncbi:hypothetical protein ACIPL1_04425 [Pseudomonas sp. NPDC090202]|uniref:hypothetical protein n=1 Tax=unclassified Pseudomonas TaxID=196821 RepID=UPI00381F1038